jgi:hypothetical protein
VNGWTVFHIIYTIIADALTNAGDREKPFPESIINFIDWTFDICFMIQENVACHLIEALGSIQPLFRIFLSLAATTAHLRAFK